MTPIGHLVLAALFLASIVLARLLTTRWAVRTLGPHVRRLADWAADRLDPAEDLDPEAEELRLLRRRERLEADLARVGRLVATDAGMSATRQLGNRLAYAGLRAELARIPELRSALVPAAPPEPVRYDHRTRSSVEILEVGWRS